MKLNNTHNIDEEISINNEIRKETEFLSSLFNIKKDELNLQNLIDNNNINQFMMMNNDLMANMIKNMNDDKYEANKEWMKGFRMAADEINNIESKINIIFVETSGNRTNIAANIDTTVNELLEKYLTKIQRPDLIGEDGIIAFIYNANRLYFGDMNKIGTIFKNFSFSKVRWCKMLSGFNFYEVKIKKLKSGKTYIWIACSFTVCVNSFKNKKNQYKNIIFKTSKGITNKLSVNFERPIGWLLKYYLVVVKKPELIKDNNNIYFLANAAKIDFNNRKAIKEFFKYENNPTINIYDPCYLIQ